MRPVEAVRVGDWVLKGYHLTLAGAEIEPATVAAAVEHLGTIVEAPLEGEPSHGFYVLHHGEDALWLIVWTWRYADIVSVACSRASLDSPTVVHAAHRSARRVCLGARRPGPRTRCLGPPHDAAPVPRPVGVPGRRPPGGPGRRSVGVAGQPVSRPRAAGAGGGWSRGAATGDGYVAGWRSAPGCGRRWWMRRTTRPTDANDPVRRRSGPGARVGPLRGGGRPSVRRSDARIPCMATVFGEPEAHPVAALVARFHADLDQLGDPRLWSISDTETDRHPRLGDRVAAPAHRARAPRRPPRRPPRPRRRSTVPPTPPPGGPTPPGRPNGTPNAASSSRKPLDCDHEPVRDAMAAGHVSEEQAAVIVKGVDALPVEHRRDGRSAPDRVRGRARPGRAPPARAPRPRSRRPRDRRRPRAQGPATPGSPRRGGLPVHHRRRRARAVPRPVHPAQPRGGDAQAGGARDQLAPSTATTPAPRRGSGTRSASTSPATRSTGSPRPAASTPPWWSP